MYASSCAIQYTEVGGDHNVAGTIQGAGGKSSGKCEKRIIDDTEHFRGPTLDDLLTDEEAEQIRKELEAAGIKLKAPS